MNPYTIPVKMFANGKITIPKQIRDILDLKDGDVFEITILPKERNDISEMGNAKAPIIA